MLVSQLETSFKDFPECLPQLFKLFPPSELFTLFEIPSTMVPPEDFDFGTSSEDSIQRRIMMPRIPLRFADDEVLVNFYYNIGIF